MPSLLNIAIFMAFLVGTFSLCGSACAGPQDELLNDAIAGDGFDGESDALDGEPPQEIPPGPTAQRAIEDLIHEPTEEDPDFDEPDVLRGDFDLDGVLDLDRDLRMLHDQIGQPDPDLTYDLDGDGLVTEADTRYWIEKIRGTFIGDVNLDHRVNSTDLTIAHQTANFGTGEPANWSTGDFNGDGVFNQKDMDFIDMSVYEQPSPRRSATESTVPEPIMLSLVGMGLVFLLLTYTAVQGNRQMKLNPADK